ncbi:Transcriptional regulator GlxA family, contains an amidase domain and an AraC-type DNA-binding HTH domain [Nonomuraea solani]|uniref:Transcriptional regulator GlxA family, contains an amidase domain and an AraC-type DNA-binding HTH domain n=1 Tax=Nonomuraea solani TaxID=1144553 RepID=A0A1H6EY34_9ACTN|nr:helix-turn-helix domain-containing protein [Nonomuraea solani]SEH02787.1 Transcriptional regulator GlxA family, contains an amidase domain and an AraC-type DNA-binding HTH domain [Nonomuraea solani]
MPHRIAVVVADHFAPLDLGVPGQVFWAARTSSGEHLYEVVTCSEGRRPVRCSAGYSVLPDHDLNVLDTADTVLVPGVHGGRVMKDGTISATLAGALRGRPRTMSICTGAFILAAAGLLDGRRATTHWTESARFARLFPQVELDPDVLFVDDGDVLTSAGVAAGMDLCLHVIRRDHGSEVANRAARRCVMPPWREGGQAQFIERPLPYGNGGGTAATRDWMLAHLHAPLDLNALAEHARMSVRTFTRRFREETGVSPAKWLTGQRVRHARHLLETTDLGVEEVARRAGFATAVSLRQHLHAAVGVPPLAYRQTFRRV